MEDIDPERAASIANEVPKVFIQQNYELQARRYADSKASLQRQIDETQASIAGLQDGIKGLEAAANPDQNELDRQRRDLQTLQTGYATLTASYEDLRLQEAKQLDTLLVTEEATPSPDPIRPKTRQNTLLAAIVGAMLALGVAYLIEYLDDVVKDPDGVKAALGLTTLAAVPVAEGNGGTSELAMIAGGQSAVTEAYRVLRTNLQFAAVGRPLHTLLVTSPSPSEGKSTMSANLAIALAQGGRRVILADCDLHRPRQHKLLKLQNNVGLTSGLLDEHADPIGLLQDSVVPGLRILTTGPLPPNPAEVLGSARMHAVMAALAAEADIVVLDSPPVLSVADSAVLASQVDGVLLVIDAGLTRREMARRALAEPGTGAGPYRGRSAEPGAAQSRGLLLLLLQPRLPQGWRRRPDQGRSAPALAEEGRGRRLAQPQDSAPGRCLLPCFDLARAPGSDARRVDRGRDAPRV